MPIVMDLDFGEDGNDVDRRTVNRQATRDTRFAQVQALEGKPYSCLSALDYGETEGYRGAQMQSSMKACMRGWKLSFSSCPPGLYIDRQVSGLGRVGYRLGFVPFEILSTLVLFSKD